MVRSFSTGIRFFFTRKISPVSTERCGRCWILSLRVKGRTKPPQGRKRKFPFRNEKMSYIIRHFFVRRVRTTGASRYEHAYPRFYFGIRFPVDRRHRRAMLPSRTADSIRPGLASFRRRRRRAERPADQPVPFHASPFLAAIRLPTYSIPQMSRNPQAQSATAHPTCASVPVNSVKVAGSTLRSTSGCAAP